jgi:O-glycosyl hydrolase
MILKKMTTCLLIAAASAAGAVERATYDSAGRLTSLVQNGLGLPLLGHFVLVLEDGREVVLQPHDQRSPITRDGLNLHWQGSPLEPLGQGVRFDVRWNEHAQGSDLQGQVSTAFARRVRSVDFVLAVPRDTFVDGHVEPGPAPLPRLKPEKVTFHQLQNQRVRLQNADRTVGVTMELDQARPMTLRDTWTHQGRWYEVRIPLHEGAWAADQTISFGARFSLEAQPPQRSVRLTINPAQPRQPFIGFGANYCWVNTSPVIDYTLEHLRSTWLRFEFKFIAWVAERQNPGPLLRRDFELMRQIQQAGHPWIISLWRIPEDFYVPRADGASAMGHGRRIAPERWDDFLRELGDYLLYLKKNYGAEPDMFSFNEPDLGVDIAFSPEEHRDAIKRIGAHFAKLGLKTKQMLGETANPRNQHRYVLATAQDPEAMQYVAGVSFHSWGGATPEQYAAWGDVAEWMQRPLFVGEAGMDPGAYRNRAYDSYGYGLREMKDHFDFIRHARVQSSLYWQYTNDYSLVRVAEDGSIHPTGRFHLMRHLSNLTPTDSRVVTSGSDQADIHVIAFTASSRFVVHVLNTGPAAQAMVQGLPAAAWKRITTVDGNPFREETWAGGAAPLEIPARGMVTLVRE